MSDSVFNPRRLTLARKRRGFSKRGLALALGQGVRTITAYELGEREPSGRSLTEIANVLRFPIAFFTAEDIDIPDPVSVSFRSFASLTASKRDAALAAGALAMELGKWIDERFSLPAPNVPDFSELNAETAADSLRAEWGLGLQPIRNMVHMIESKGVRVFSLAEENREVDAFSLWRENLPWVFLNTMKSGERSRIDAAHELGHLVLHRTPALHKRAAEWEARRFGSAFLMPRSTMLTYGAKTYTIKHLMQIKKHWGVSLAALAYRLHDVGLIKDWNYRHLYIELSAAGYRTNEPDPMPPETSQVLQKVFALLRQEGISKDVMARDVHLLPDEINSLVFGLVMLPLTGGKGRKLAESTRTDLRLLKS